MQLVSNFLTMMTMWWQAREHYMFVTNTTVKVKSSRQCNTNPPLLKLYVNSPVCSIIFCDLWGNQCNYVLYYVWASWWKAACQGRWHYGISDILYSLVKVPHGSNNPNISDYLAFIMLLVSLKHYSNGGYWLSSHNLKIEESTQPNCCGEQCKDSLVCGIKHYQRPNLMNESPQLRPIIFIAATKFF